MTELRDKIKELAEIAASVPENLQAVCFEVLLRDYLAAVSATGTGAKKKSEAKGKDDSEAAAAASAKTVEEAAKDQADVTLADLHVKARKFMEKYSVSISELNNLFYKEGTSVRPLYEDLKTTRMSEAQIRIALLQALRSGLVDGEFAAQVENIRTECRDRKALDVGNFSANFNNNVSLFDFEKYGKDTKDVRLSENGRKELAQLIKELQ
jgi:hypothetical protein